MTKRGIVFGRTGLGIFTYFFQPMRIDGQFPFVNDFDPSTVYQGITIMERQIGGAFMIFPILIFALVGVFKKKIFKDRLLYRVSLFSVVAAFLVAVLDTQMAGILMRYFTDFNWLLMLASVSTIFALCLAHSALTSAIIPTESFPITVTTAFIFLFSLCV